MFGKNLIIENHHFRNRQTLNMLALRMPGLAFILMIYAASIVIQLTNGYWSTLLLIVFTILIVIFSLLHWYSHRWVKNRSLYYFGLQGLIIYILAEFMSSSYVAAIYGLYAFLMGQIIGMVERRKKCLFFYLILLLSGNAAHQIQPNELVNFLVACTPMMIVVITYTATFFAQVNEKVITQLTLEKLEFANQQVEQLTLQNERQRVARDLHDTLAQGLVSLNMQLEAVDIHLSRGNLNRAREIIQQSIVRVKSSLTDARSAIDNLRRKSEKSDFLKERITSQMNLFKQTKGLSYFFDYRLNLLLDIRTAENIYYIIGECITNVAKHADAEMVWLSIWDEKGHIHLKIKDNGKGFDVEKGKKKRGHYGLLGIQERVTVMNGKLNIMSIKSTGTQIEIIVPILGVINDE